MMQYGLYRDMKILLSKIIFRNQLGLKSLGLFGRLSFSFGLLFYL